MEFDMDQLITIQKLTEFEQNMKQNLEIEKRRDRRTIVKGIKKLQYKYQKKINISIRKIMI